MVDEGALINLAEGRATMIGDGVFVVFQDSDEGLQNVVLTRSDLEALLATT
ncbi:hypothetical protein SPMU_01090 [Sphingomonas mucosissima]|uniref:Uncharacterized protein n=1 Tax=Sphingomonas mucosissima TaxID=370959 RepID=A0A245ZPX6_9SPHN|nr:hypothetical protein SPMU_01090 [Sphingomonas mucosissima]